MSARKLIPESLRMVARGGAEVAVRVNNEPALLAAYPLLNNSTRVGDREVADDIRHWIEDLYRGMGRPEAAREYFTSLPPPTAR